MPQPPAPPTIELADPLTELADLSARDDHDGVVLAGTDLSGRAAQDLRLTRSRLHDCALHGAVLDGALLAECHLERLTATTLDLVGARLRDVEISGGRIGDLRAHDAELARVAVRGTRLGYVNLRGATLTDVRFSGCVISDLDVGEATLQRVTLDDCTVERLLTRNAALDTVDLTGAEVQQVAAVDHLRGVTISTAQLAVFAGAFADHLGIAVAELG
ncbi:pentapeptide repeat-containing protein [soil metagenome]